MADEPGIVTLDADMSSGYVYAQIPLIWKLEEYLGEGGMGARLRQDRVPHLLLRGLALQVPRRPPAAGIGGAMSLLGMVNKFKHKGEIRESKDEIFIGEMIYLLSLQGWPCIGLHPEDHRRRGHRPRATTCRTCASARSTTPCCTRCTSRLDRKTGTGALSAALAGSKATLLRDRRGQEPPGRSGRPGEPVGDRHQEHHEVPAHGPGQGQPRAQQHLRGEGHRSSTSTSTCWPVSRGATT